MATVAVTDEPSTPRSASRTFRSSSTSGPNGAAPASRSARRLKSSAPNTKASVKIVKVNVDENPNSPGQLGVRGIPTLFLFKDGEVVSNKVGAAPKAALKSWIDDAV
jgi:thioredoxin 1